MITILPNLSHFPVLLSFPKSCTSHSSGFGPPVGQAPPDSRRPGLATVPRPWQIPRTPPAPVLNVWTVTCWTRRPVWDDDSPTVLGSRSELHHLALNPQESRQAMVGTSRPATGAWVQVPSRPIYLSTVQGPPGGQRRAARRFVPGKEPLPGVPCTRGL